MKIKTHFFLFRFCWSCRRVRIERESVSMRRVDSADCWDSSPWRRILFALGKYDFFSVCSYAFLGTRLFPIHICMFLYESSVREFCTRVLYESSVLVRSVRWVRTGTVRRLCGDLQCGLSMRLPVRFQIFLEIEAGSSYRLANSPADLDSEYLSSLLKSV